MNDKEKAEITEELEGLVAVATTYFPQGFYSTLSIKPASSYYHQPTVIVGMTLPHGTQIKFSVTVDPYQLDRVKVQEHLHETLTRHLSYNHTRREITFARDKDRKKIANDILKRFLVDYVDFYVDLVQQRERSREYYRKVDDNTDLLARSNVNVTRSLKRGEDETERRTLDIRGAAENKVYGRGDVSSDSVNLTLNNLSIELAEQVLKLVTSGRR
jgi:hypothetical protein